VRSTACLGAAIAAAIVLSTAQTTAPTTTFRAYQFGREIGRETDAVSVDGGTRTFVSTYVTRDRIGELTLTGTLETALDATPRRLRLTGSVDREASIDLDVSVDGRRVQMRNRGVSSAIDLPGETVALLDGGVPALFEEQLIRYWRVQGRPAELPVAGGGVLRIARRADEQFDIAGRNVTLERLTIDGPVWENQTAWVDASGTLDVLITPVQGRQVALIRPGFESRLHMHTKSFQVCYVVDGSGEFQLGDEVFHAKKGACVNIPPGVPHKVGSKEGMRMLMVYSPPGLEGMMKAMKALSPEQLADGALTSRLLAEHDTVVLGESAGSKGYGSVLG